MRVETFTFVVGKDSQGWRRDLCSTKDSYSVKTKFMTETSHTPQKQGRDIDKGGFSRTGSIILWSRILRDTGRTGYLEVLSSGVSLHPTEVEGPGPTRGGRRLPE